jgi:hypothetical protein
MDEEKRTRVFSQYIDQYLPVIDKTLVALRSNESSLHIPYAQFLFSVIDYFGLIFSVSQGKYNKRDTNNFVNFFNSHYFSKKDRCKSKFLWFIRNGLIHQIFPKASGVGAKKENNLFFPDSRNGNNITLNLTYLDEILVIAIKDFIEDIRNDSNSVNNLFEILIENHYGLDDHLEIKKEIDLSFGGDISRIYSECT